MNKPTDEEIRKVALCIFPHPRYDMRRKAFRVGYHACLNDPYVKELEEKATKWDEQQAYFRSAMIMAKPVRLALTIEDDK